MLEKGLPMAKKAKVTIASEDDLAHARTDPSFRHQLMTKNLDMLLSELNRLRTKAGNKAETDRHIREGANLAVKLAELLQRIESRRRS